MRVLLVATDLFKTAGGGEVVYRKLIAANPEIGFTYFRKLESASAVRPANARAIPLSPARPLADMQRGLDPVRLGNLRLADSVARSVANENFDVIELPDYQAFGTFLRERLSLHRVRYEAIVLAMHGNISTSFALDWESSRDTTDVEQQLELEQFVDADARYAISKRYIGEWKRRADLEVHYIDPLSIVGLPGPVPWAPSMLAPELYCVGRMERRKGNDLFVELLRWVDPALYGRACHIGDAVQSRSGASSESMLRAIAGAREARIDFLPSQKMEGLAEIYGRNSLIVLPVRYDSFNLVALEVLLRGCPVVVSDAAGVCDYLDAELSSIPYVKIEMANFYGVLPEIEHVLSDYSSYRRDLVERVRTLKQVIPTPDLHAIYETAIARGRGQEAGGCSSRGTPRQPATEPIQTRSIPPPRELLFGLARLILPRKVRRLLRDLIRTPKKALSALLYRLGVLRDANLAWQAVSSSTLKSSFRTFNGLREDDPAALTEKVRQIHRTATSPVCRCNVWNELARLEQLRGNELVAVSYELRLMRLLGADRFGRLNQVLEALERHGLHEEALACNALYGTAEATADRVLEYLQAAYRRNLHSSPREDWAAVDDRRRGNPKVSVIVSLYNAAPKLRLFLTALSRQTLVRKGSVEVVLVDSGSKTNEYEIFDGFMRTRPLDAIYARSKQRETIQAAWNRGIHLSRAPYLVFLGVDETLYPEALEMLASELDSNAAVDWVMANSLVTSVDQHGVFEKDVMPYDRTGGTKDHTYLETCYLSWVGGMYRKSVHDRYGFYDETFRAAGDTEFKNRVLPYMNVKFVPRTLGLFLNYPDERTTASPLAEIEDTRAWYLHRTPGGVRYAFANRDPGEALALFYAALGYRKSYCRHVSSDVEYALHLLDHARKAGLGAELTSVSTELARLLDSYQGLEWIGQGFGALSPGARLLHAWRLARQTERKHTSILEGRAEPTYRVLNDNRYEQHSWHWDTFR